eukprot:s687_g15.t1
MYHPILARIFQRSGFALKLQRRSWHSTCFQRDDLGGFKLASGFKHGSIVKQQERSKVHPAQKPPEPIAMSGESNSSDLVTFNVGGKIYQVLREPTLSLHPNSLLTQLAEDQKDDKPIFVEGDQDLFKFVIDYHRDRKVILPILVAKDAVLRELKRFNLEPADDQIVEDGVAFSSVKRKMSDWRDESRKMRRLSATEMLCSGIMEAAVEKSDLDVGNGFTVNKMDLVEALGLDDNVQVFNNIFDEVTGKAALESESLQRFARSFGYSISVSLENNFWSWTSSHTPRISFTPTV